LRWSSAWIDQIDQFEGSKKEGRPKPPTRGRRANYIGQIFQITPVPGI